MTSGRAYGSTKNEDKSVVIIEPNKQMQHLLRAMLANFGCRKVRVFADSEEAVSSMLTDIPSLVLMDWNAGPYKGRHFLKLIRHQKMFPLCVVPILVMFSRAGKNAVESDLRLGAQAALVKPISPVGLMQHIDWVISNKRELKLVGERYVVEGMAEQLDLESEKHQQLDDAREYQAEQVKAMDSIQNDVDRILSSSF